MTSAARYELLDRIALGGMAELFRARIAGEQGFFKIVAVKRILPQYAGDASFVRMLVDEARTASHLSHPSIAEVYELRRDEDGGLFIAMEFVNGPSLAALLRNLGASKRLLPPACAVDVAIHLLEALDYAHRMPDASGQPLNLVHRDVSPDNVLVTRDGAVKLTDFGVAKARGRLTQTQQGTIKGKVAYMAPEQVRGLSVDGRADIFAAALVLWEAFTGKAYYEAPDDYELMKQVAEGRRRKLSEVGLAVPPEIEAALAKALAHEASDRYPRAADFARELTSCHRRTWPEYSPSELGRLVEENFHDRFAILAERLRRFESGEEKPSGLISPAPSEPSTVPTAPMVAAPTPADSSKTPLDAQPVAPEPAARRRSPRPEAPPIARRASKSDNPQARRPSKSGAAKKSKESTPAVATDAQAIDAALKSAKAAEKGEARKGSGLLKLLAVVVLFAAAAGAGIYAMNWLRGGEADGTPPPEPASPIAKPGEDEAARPVKPPAKPAERAKDPKKLPEKIAERPQPNPAPPPADGPKGTLDLECDPGDCEIEIDGRKLGFAPLRDVELATGAHKVRAFNRLINLRKQITVEIEAGKTAKKAINLVKD